MVTRGKTTFQKRQKEMARKDKQQRKVARRAQKKLDNSDADSTVLQDEESSSELEPTESEPDSEPQKI